MHKRMNSDVYEYPSHEPFQLAIYIYGRIGAGQKRTSIPKAACLPVSSPIQSSAVENAMSSLTDLAANNICSVGRHLPEADRKLPIANTDSHPKFIGAPDGR